MAEAAGLVIGGVSLASLFTSCVDSFNYLRIGQAFGDDFPVYQTEVDVLELRFSRWAQAVQQLSTAKNPAITPDVAKLVEKNLSQLSKLFRRAREDSEEYEQDEQPEALVVKDPSQVPKVAKVHTKLRALVHSRQKDTRDPKLSKEFKWAIYKKNEFVELIVKARQKVDDLEKLISVDELRTKLAEMQIEDATEIRNGTTQDIKLVQDGVKDVDPVFGNTLAMMQPGASFSLVEIAEEAKVQMGDSFENNYTGPLSNLNYDFHNVKIGPRAIVSLGNTYGSTVWGRRSQFDTPGDT